MCICTKDKRARARYGSQQKMGIFQLIPGTKWQQSTASQGGGLDVCKWEDADAVVIRSKGQSFHLIFHKP